MRLYVLKVTNRKHNAKEPNTERGGDDFFGEVQKFDVDWPIFGCDWLYEDESKIGTDN